MLTRTPGKKVPLKPPSRFGATEWRMLRYGSMVTPLLGAGAAAAGLPGLGLAVSAGGTLLHFHARNKIPKPIFEVKQDDPYVWFGKDSHDIDIRIPVSEITRHMLLIGTTGSGKTTLLRLLVHTLLKQGGGVTFVDGKADVADMYAVFYSLVADADRLEDLLVLNFLNPAQSHTFNPFKYGDSDFLSEVLAGLLPGMSGDGEYWQGRAKIMMRSLMTVLVWLRDNRDYPLDIGTIREGLALQKLAGLASNDDIPLETEDGRPIRSRLESYLNELGPNWRLLLQPNGGGAQAAQALKAISEQHGYAIQQWSEPLDLLSGKYRKIFMCDGAPSDIDMKDVVSNSRVLYVLLPSLELSPTTLKGLGRMILSTFKIAFTSALGKDVIGDFSEVRREIYAKRPKPAHLLIADEYGSYAVEGFDTVLAQARSLGLGVVISVQELASLFKANEQEAKRLIGNTNIKVALKIEDPDTSKYFVERSGEDWVLIPSAREVRGTFKDNFGNADGSFQYQKQSRLDAIDTVDLKPGQGYIILGSELRKFFYPFIQGKDPTNMVLWSYVPKGLPSPEAAAAAQKASGAQVDPELSRLKAFLGIDPQSSMIIARMKTEFGYGASDVEIMQKLYEVSGPLEDDLWAGRQRFKKPEDFRRMLVALGFPEAMADSVMDIIDRRKQFNQFREVLNDEAKACVPFLAEMNRAGDMLYNFLKD